MGLDFKARALRRRNVVMAVAAGGDSDAVALEFGLSRASVYNWSKDYRDQGVKGLIHEKGDRRFAFSGKSANETMRLVRKMVQKFPDLSADKLSMLFQSYGLDVSARTLRNIFKRLGVSTAQMRRKGAIQPDYSDVSISIEEWSVILEQIEIEQAAVLSGRKQGDRLLQDRVKFPKGYCDEPLAIEIVVDTFASSRRIYALVGPPSHQLSVELFAAVERIYKSQGLRIHKVCTPRKQQYSEDLGAVAYPRRFKNPMGSIQEVGSIKERTADPRIKDAWSILQTGWLMTMPTRLTTDQRISQLIDDDLEAWLVAHRGACSLVQSAK